MPHKKSAFLGVKEPEGHIESEHHSKKKSHTKKKHANIGIRTHHGVHGHSKRGK